MKSGKSTEIFRQMERKHLAGKRVLYIGPPSDDRKFYARGILKEKLFQVANCITVANWNYLETIEILDYLNNYDAIFIDEYFMIANNKRLCTLVSSGKCDIYFGGLLADANAIIWPEAIEILPYCDNIIKLNAVCEECGSEYANYSYMKGIKPGQLVIGDTEYKALCRKCYLNKKNKEWK